MQKMHATASLTLAQLALSIFCKSPFILGTNICSTKYIASPVILTSPNMQGQNWELPDDMVRVPTSPFWCSETDPHMFIQDLKDFFLKVATAYYKKIDYRWNLAAFTFLSGINCKAAHEAILDFSTALEALLNTGTESISFKVRYYSALLLGENYSERLAIRKDIGEFYSLRSKIIHGKFTNISSKELAQIARTGGYIGNLLMKTCGRSIESDVFKELDYMSLLGAPKLSNTHSCIVITEEDIVDAFKKHKCIDGLLSYKFVLEKNVYDDNELTLYIETIDDEHLAIDPLQYIFYVPAMRGINSFSHWIKGNDDGKYEYVISK